MNMAMGASGRLGLASGFALAAALAFPAPAGGTGAGFSLRFTGIDGGAVDRVSLPVWRNGRSTSLNIGDTGFTIELWIRGRLADNSAPGIACSSDSHWTQGNVVLDRDRHGQSRDFGLSFAGGRVIAGIATESASKTVCSPSPVLDDRWHHIAFQHRYDGGDNGSVWLFVDGTVAGSASWVRGSAAYPSGAEPRNDCPGPCIRDPLLMLGGGKVAGVRSFRGFIDEMRVSNVARYPDEGFLRPIEPFRSDGNTAGLYHFDEGTGTTIHDALKAPTDGARAVSAAGGPEWWTATPFTSGPGVRVGAPRSTASSSAVSMPSVSRPRSRPAPSVPPSAAPSIAGPASDLKDPVQAFFPRSSKSLSGPPPVAIALAGVGIAIAIAVHFLRSDRDGERL